MSWFISLNACLYGEAVEVAVVQNMSYMSMPNGDKQYIFGKTDAGFAIADA